MQAVQSATNFLERECGSSSNAEGLLSRNAFDLCLSGMSISGALHDLTAWKGAEKAGKSFGRAAEVLGFFVTAETGIAIANQAKRVHAAFTNAGKEDSEGLLRFNETFDLILNMADGADGVCWSWMALDKTKDFTPVTSVLECFTNTVRSSRSLRAFFAAPSEAKVQTKGQDKSIEFLNKAYKQKKWSHLFGAIKYGSLGCSATMAVFGIALGAPMLFALSLIALIGMLASSWCQRAAQDAAKEAQRHALTLV